MSMAPWRQAAGSVRPCPRTWTGRQRELIQLQPPVALIEQDPDEILEDARVHGGGALSAAASLGDLEGRVHGLSLARAITWSSTAGSSPLSHHLMPLLCREEKALSRLLDKVEKSLVVPRCLNTSASMHFPDSSRRLDKYMAAAKQLLLQQAVALVASERLRDRYKSLLNTAMSSLAMEFCYTEIWSSDALRGLNLGISPASIRESVRPKCSSDSDSASGSSLLSCSDSYTGTSCSKDSGFNAYHASLGVNLPFRGDEACSDINYIDSKSLSILNDIAGFMIESGYERTLREAFNQHCVQLARNIEILDIDNILSSHMEESKENLLMAWTSSVHLIVGFLCEMRRHLTGYDFGSFNVMKEDYFLAIAKVHIMKLLNSVSSIYIQVVSCKDRYAATKPDLSRILNVVIIYQALNYTMPTISALLSGQTKELILTEGEGIMNGLSDMFVKLFVELNNLQKSQHLAIVDTGVHCATKNMMDNVRVLLQQSNTICLMLKGDQKAFGELVIKLISSLESMLEINSRSLQLQGQQQMFLLNNMHFVLEESRKSTDLGLILGECWFLQCHAQLDQFMTGYMDASWAPVLSLFERRARVPEILWHHQLLEKFTSSFEMTCTIQRTWKVTDPLIRRKVREAISQKVIPLYRMHMDSYSEKKLKPTKYSIEQLESELQELFEG